MTTAVALNGDGGGDSVEGEGQAGPPRPPEGGGAETLLEFRGAEKRFPDGTLAVTGVDLTVRRGDFISLVGPSGCGKSTLLRLASGLTSASDGMVVTHTEKVGYVFQDPTLLPWRSVRRNVEMLGELTGMPKGEYRRRAGELIELVGLAGFERHRPRSLSGGMRMRVSLARSLLLSPDLFLLDEPFGALDEISRERLNDELLRLFGLSHFGAAMFVTHSVAEAVFLATRVVVMSAHPGRVVEILPVPFGYPRSPDLRYTPEFTNLTGRVSRLLRTAEAGAA